MKWAVYTGGELQGVYTTEDEALEVAQDIRESLGGLEMPIEVDVEEE